MLVGVVIGFIFGFIAGWFITKEIIKYGLRELEKEYKLEKRKGEL